MFKKDQKSVQRANYVKILKSLKCVRRLVQYWQNGQIGQNAPLTADQEKALGMGNHFSRFFKSSFNIFETKDEIITFTLVYSVWNITKEFK